MKAFYGRVGHLVLRLEPAHPALDTDGGRHHGVSSFPSCLA